MTTDINFGGNGISNIAAATAAGEAVRFEQVFGTGSTLTISSGSITPTQGFHLVGTEGGAAEDDLDTIATTNVQDGGVVHLQAASGKTIYVTRNGNVQQNALLPDDRPLTFLRSGTDFVLLAGGWVRIGAVEASNDAFATFDNLIDASTDTYLVRFAGVRPANDDTKLYAELKNSSGWVTSSYRFATARNNEPTPDFSAGGVSSGSNGFIRLQGSGTDNQTNTSLNGWLEFYNPADSGRFTTFTSQTMNMNNNGQTQTNVASGYLDTAEVNDGIRFYFDSGNIAVGSVTLYAWYG